MFFVVVITFFSVAFHYFFPNIFVESIGVFVREIKVSELGGARGASGLAPEPGFTGSLAVFYIVVSVYIYEARKNRAYLLLNIALCLAIIFFSRSGSAAFLLVIFVFFYYFKFNFFSLLFLTLSIFAIYSVTSVVDLGRSGYVINLLFENPAALFLGDASVGKRVINIVIGFLSVYENPFGFGAGSYDRISEAIVNDYGLSTFIESQGIDNVSAFAKYSVEIGLLFWILFVFAWFLMISLKGSRGNSFFVVSLYFVSATFSIVFPPTWFLIAMMHAKESRTDSTAPGVASAGVGEAHTASAQNRV